MGFYGNITYNTYGLQNESVKPQHLDRAYWQYITSDEVIGIDGLRKFLELEVVNNDDEGKKAWEEKWEMAKQKIYKFYLPDVPENDILIKLLGSGMLLGWVCYFNNIYYLYILSLGSRAGQIFRYAINPFHNDDLPSDLSYDDWEDINNETQAINWLLQKRIVTSQIKDKNITTEKIADNAITTDKIATEAVTTEKIANKDVTPSKLDRDYWERTVWSSITSYETLFQNCTAIPTNGAISDTDLNKGTLYIVKSLQLFLPAIYTDVTNKSTFLIESNKKYNFGQCFIQNNDNIITIISGTTGQFWTIQKVTTMSEETVAESDQYYKVNLKQTTTPMIKDRSISTIKIAPNAVVGGDIGDPDSIIAPQTITSYNIKPYAISGAAEEQSNIKEKTITSYNIADNTITDKQIALKTITQDNLKDSYARCFYGEGIPGTTIDNFGYNEEATKGDLYIDTLTGYIYCYKGYNFQLGKHEWVSTQDEFWLKGENSTTRPASPTIGTMWMDSDSGRLWIYKRTADTDNARWEELKSYQIENKDIKDNTITASKLAPGTIQTFLLNNTLLTIPCADPKVGLTEEDVENFILSDFSNVDYPLFIISYGTEGNSCLLGYNINRPGSVKYNSLDCLDLIGKTFCRLRINNNPNRLHPIDRIDLETMGKINMDTKPYNPSSGALFYNADKMCLEVFDGEKWNFIYGYNQSNAPLTLEEQINYE